MSLETMTKLASTTVGVGGSSSIEFTNIPQNYTDLCLEMSTRSSSAISVAGLSVQFNSDTTSGNYTWRRLYGAGSGAPGSDTNLNIIILSAANNTSSTFGNGSMYISNYAGNSTKSISAYSVSENNGTTAYQLFGSGLWSSSAAISSIKLVISAGNFDQHSTATLYGIKNMRQTAGNSIKATGGNIVFDGTYVYHVFNATGSFTPTQSILADALVVAGGGGGGAGAINYGGGGGGGAGGLLGFSNQSFSSGITYTCTVGAGGAGGASGANPGVVGSDSQIGALTTVKGGGYGGTYSGTTSGGTGGSGGGASQNGSGGAATSGQGNAGGTGTSSGSYWGGSGGGAGAAATNASGATSSTAGIGSSAYSAWGLATGQGQNVSGTYYFAGGGGGGNGLGASGSAGGSGGGGSGGQGSSSSVAGNPGTANTGGGGGGVTIQSAAAAGGAGGSGIVIIRYKG